MARTPVPYSKLVSNGSLVQPAGTAIDQANGMVINEAEPERTVLRISNSAATPKNAILRAGTYPPAWAAGQGDLTIQVANGATVFIGPFESGRFVKSHRGVEIDFEAGATGTITALLVPTAQ
jgi:hypothetical protein